MKSESTMPVGLKWLVALHAVESVALLVLIVWALIHGLEAPGSKNVFEGGKKVLPVLLAFTVGIFKRWVWVPQVGRFMFGLVSFLLVFLWFVIRRQMGGNDLARMIFDTFMLLAAAQSLVAAVVFHRNRGYFNRTASSQGADTQRLEE